MPSQRSITRAGPRALAIARIRARGRTRGARYAPRFCFVAREEPVLTGFELTPTAPLDEIQQWTSLRRRHARNGRHCRSVRTPRHYFRIGTAARASPAACRTPVSRWAMRNYRRWAVAHRRATVRPLAPRCRSSWRSSWGPQHQSIRQASAFIAICRQPLRMTLGGGTLGSSGGSDTGSGLRRSRRCLGYRAAGGAPVSSEQRSRR